MIRTLYAHNLFRRGEYDTALNIFQELDTDPADVIRLYPEMISGGLAEGPDAGEHDIEEELLSSPVLRSKRNEELTSPIQTSSSIHQTSRPASIISSRSKATTVTEKPKDVPLTGLNLHDAVTFLIRFLTDKRQKLSKKLSTSSSTRSSTKEGQGHRQQEGSPASSTEGGGGGELFRQATLVDTALLKSYMMTNDALVGPLLRVQNHCDVQECETILSDKKVNFQSLYLLWPARVLFFRFFPCSVFYFIYT